MAQTTFGQFTTFGDLGDLRFPVFRMTISEMLGAVLKMSAITNTTLSKVYSMLGHWKEDGNNIIIYDDDNEELMTIPTVKNKYGDILQMGEIPEEDPR